MKARSPGIPVACTGKDATGGTPSATSSTGRIDFRSGSPEVGHSDPTDAELQADFVRLPTMTATGGTDRGSFLTVTLSPSQSLTINSGTDNTAVLAGRCRFRRQH